MRHLKMGGALTESERQEDDCTSRIDYELAARASGSYRVRATTGFISRS